MSERNHEVLLRLAEEYIAETSKRASYQKLLWSSLEPFLEAHPGQIFVEALNTTQQLAQWVSRPSFLAQQEDSRRLQIRVLRGFTAWLLKCGQTEHDAYYYVALGPAAQGEVSELDLKLNLQKEIVCFRSGCKDLDEWMVSGAVQAAHRFNLYRNHPKVLELSSEELLSAWLRETSNLYTLERTNQLLFGLARFSEFVTDTSLLPDVSAWLSRYRSGRAVIKNLDDLSCALKHPRFRSDLSDWLEAFLKFCEARKMRLDPIEANLRGLDRVAWRHCVKEPRALTRSMLLEYLEENGPAPATFNQRLGRLRGFRRFLERKSIKLDWPTGLCSRQVPAFRPHLYTLAEIGRILETLESIGDAKYRNRFYWKGLKLIVFLLYAGGMRLREPIRLRLQDVDLERGLLFIHNTKFYKQRWVPLGKMASQRLADYFDERCRHYPKIFAPDEPFFLNSRGGPVCTSNVESAFRKVLRTLQMKGRGTRPSPRLHDLRHSAAVHKLYQWYSEGKDVQNKLPLLSAYLGHDRLQHTEKYLHLTEDLLRLAGGDFRISFEKIVGRAEQS